MNQNYTKYAFTPSVKKAQEHYGSRKTYARVEQGPDRFLLSDKEKAYIQSRDFFFMSTVGENGWPYVQYRGGPEGFLHALDDHTLAFADFSGNRQYISVGNIQSGGKVALILLDFAHRVRLKIWATATVEDAADNPELAKALSNPDYHAQVERIITLTVEAYDWNCPQHIKPRFTAEEVAANIDLFLPDTNQG